MLAQFVCIGLLCWIMIKVEKMGLPKMRWAVYGMVITIVIWSLASMLTWSVMSDSIYAFYRFVLTATITVVVTRKIALYLLKNARLPEYIDCPDCGVELELDMQERQEQRFQCSECGHISNISEQLIAQPAAQSVEGAVN